MRILIGADTYAPDVNGASYFAQRLAAGFAERGHDVHVAAPAGGLCSRIAMPVGRITEHRLRSVPVARPRGFRLCPPTGLLRRARKLMDRISPDVVHVQSHLLVGRALLAAAAERDVPTVATTHMVPDNLLPALPVRPLPTNVLRTLFWRDAARVLGRAGVVTAPTAHAADLAERHGVAGPIRPVSNGLDSMRFRPDTAGRAAAFRSRHGLGQGPLIGFVGRLDREKHVDELVRALALLPDGLDARLVVVGDGAERARVLAAARHTGVAGRVVLTGRLDDDEIPDAYAAFDVFANAGTAELQSLSTLEAMATALPVVAVDAGALPHLVRHGENGWRYPHDDVETLARALRDVLGDRDRARRMGAASRRMALEHSLPRTLDAFEELYRRPPHEGCAAAGRLRPLRGRAA